MICSLPEHPCVSRSSPSTIVRRTERAGRHYTPEICTEKHIHTAAERSPPGLTFDSCACLCTDIMLVHRQEHPEKRWRLYAGNMGLMQSSSWVAVTHSMNGICFLTTFPIRRTPARVSASRP